MLNFTSKIAVLSLICSISAQAASVATPKVQAPEPIVCGGMTASQLSSIAASARGHAYNHQQAIAVGYSIQHNCAQALYFASRY